MGIFGSIKDAKYSEGGIYIVPGVYRVKVLKVLYKKLRSGKDAFIVEVEVVDSTNPERLPGSQMSWMVTLDKEPALGNIKQFIAELFGCDMSAVQEQHVEALIDEIKNPGAGKFIRCAAVNIKTKANRDFTKVKWIRDAAGAAAAEAEHAKG